MPTPSSMDIRNGISTAGTDQNLITQRSPVFSRTIWANISTLTFRCAEQDMAPSTGIQLALRDIRMLTNVLTVGSFCQMSNSPCVLKPV